MIRAHSSGEGSWLTIRPRGEKVAHVAFIHALDGRILETQLHEMLIFLDAA